ncbi:hypothetical protein [Amycolatopsis sp. NPDC051071]|uniref:hypothetical protein n=1 Tax=Amycolatopsis sp. NPDC051071 TaxID=3154637 RepID=UPI003419BB81
MRRTNWIAVGIAVFALLAAGYAVWEPYTVRQDAAAIQSQAKGLADQVADACAKGGQAAAELGPACAKAAEVKDQAPVAAQAAPDPAMIRTAARTAVADYCAAPSHPCRGPDGTSPPFALIVDAVVSKIPTPRDGRDGKDAATPDFAAQVAAYCGQANEPCRGPAGATGLAGQDGQDGKQGADGAPGPTCPDGYTAQARQQAAETWWVCVSDDSPIPPN